MIIPYVQAESSSSHAVALSMSSFLDLNDDAGIDWSGMSRLDSPDLTISSAMDWINPIIPDAGSYATNGLPTDIHSA